MADFNDTYKKAGLLMQSALKKYNEGDLDGGDHDRAEANKLYDSAEMSVNAEQAKQSMLYGENRNFGTVYKVFESNVPSLLKGKGKNPQKIRKIVKLIKEDKTLYDEFKTYRALAYTDGVNDAENYVNEALSLIPNFSKKQIKESNQKMIDLMHDFGLNELVPIDDNDIKLFESIEYVMLNPKRISNLNDYMQARNNIVENITERNLKLSKMNESSEKDIDKVYKEGIEEIENKYKYGLNEDEKKEIDRLMTITDKPSYFNEKKNEALSILKSKVNECTDEDHKNLTEIIENIEKRQFVEDKFIGDISEFNEIKQMLI